MPDRPPEPRISYLVGRLHRALRKALDDRIRAHGLTVAQYAALSLLGAQPGLSNAQLARRSFMSAQSANQVLHVLVEQDLVRREQDPTHGRVGRTKLTARGRKVLAACDRVVDAVEADLLGSLTAKERTQLLGNLRACLRALDPSYRG